MDVATAHTEAAFCVQAPENHRAVWRSSSAFSLARMACGTSEPVAKRRAELGRPHPHHSALLPAVTFAMRWKTKRPATFCGPPSVICAIEPGQAVTSLP